MEIIQFANTPDKVLSRHMEECIEVKMLFSFSLVVILDPKVFYFFHNIKDRHHFMLEKRSLVESHLNVITHKLNIEHRTDRTY